ncbi:ESX secretion-associated protein EspG [Actinophytocola sp.]|uniref:ESX secretion-associated protein EspG n=1 Tax=Actinophytocola sp. TaxID=1872138 RepID=UPI003D6BE3C5
MTISARSAVPVGVAEVDLLCAAANSAPPFPLRIPNAGTTIRERRAVLRIAREQLAVRGLADERGPLGVAEAFAYLLQDCTLALDMVLSIGDDVLGAVLLARQDIAVLTTQELTGDHTLRMAELRLDDAVDELLGFVPSHDAAMTSPFSLPTGALDRVHRDLLSRRTRGPLEPDEWANLLARHGVDDRTARRLASYLQPVLGNGQVGLATRGGYAMEWRRVGAELRWLDTERGRFQLVAGADGEWMSVNPMHANELANAVRRMAGELRG